MSGIYNNTNPFDGYTNYEGPRVNPFECGETKGVCSGCPGEGTVDRNCDGCMNCARRGMGNCWDPNGYVAPVAPKVVYSERQRKISESAKIAAKNRKKTKVCQWPGCTENVKSGFCTKKHSLIVSNRRMTWKRKHPGTEPPNEWLFRDVDSQPACDDKARELGFESAIAATYKYYFEDMLPLRRVSKILGVSNTTVASILRGAGYKLRPGGGKRQ